MTDDDRSTSLKRLRERLHESLNPAADLEALVDEMERLRREVARLTRQLAAMTAALDEACTRWLDLVPIADISEPQRAAECERIAELRKVGAK